MRSRSRSFALASSACVLLLVSSAARAEYRFDISYSGEYQFASCSCEDPDNGSVGGEFVVNTPNYAGTYRGISNGVSYTISVKPNAVPVDGAYAAIDGTFTAYSGDGVKMYWEISTDTTESPYSGGLSMYAWDSDEAGLGYGNSQIFFAGYTYTVDEPENLAMLLAGLSVVGYQARRTRAA